MSPAHGFGTTCLLTDNDRVLLSLRRLTESFISYFKRNVDYSGGVTMSVVRLRLHAREKKFLRMEWSSWKGCTGII